MNRALPIASFLVAAGAVMGCDSGLPQPQIVITPRVLAVIADHPEATPGQDIRLHVVAYDPMDRPLHYVWRACLSVPSLLESAGVPLDDVPCTDLMTDAPDVVVSGASTTAVIEQLRLAARLAMGMAAGFGEQQLNDILGTAGLAFTVQVDVTDETGAVLVRAFKRVGLTTRAPTTNPPAIHYLVGDTAVSMPVEGWTGSGDECVVWGDPITVMTEGELVIAPQTRELEWTETFPVYDYAGGVTENEENGYYSFYATAGELNVETTSPPDRDATFTAPDEPGRVRMWLVLRDGHLGTRACTFVLEVVAP